MIILVAGRGLGTSFHLAPTQVFKCEVRRCETF
jgi:hypothetical protein